jgi:hypothetical protein
MRQLLQESIVRKTFLARLVGLAFPAIAGATPSVPDIGAMPDQAGLLNALLGINPWPATSYNAAANISSFTATPQQVMSGQDTVLALTGTASAGVALTLPAVATLLAALTPQQAVVGSSVCLRVLNNATTQTVTMTTNTGWTLNGTMTLATGTFRDFIVTITGTGASAAATLQDIGAGTAP